MNFLKMVKTLTVLAVMSLFVACSSAPKVDDAATEAQAAAAIKGAELVIASVDELGGDSSVATATLTKAKAALAAGNFDEAISLANQAKSEAEAALAARRAALASAAENNAPVAASSTYLVVDGDSLWSIAGNASTYGDPYQWPLIYKANKAKIKDADAIEPGQVFDITTGSSSEIKAAVEYAKTRGAWSFGSIEASDLKFLTP